MITLDLIRHGEPAGGRLYRGHGLDDPLSDKGWQQMRQAVGDACPWHALLSSPMQRCRAFADASAPRRSASMPLAETAGFPWQGTIRCGPSKTSGSEVGLR